MAELFFLDEIGEIPLELQPKLLRILQEREFERLGSTRTIYTEARLVAATNRDLKSMVEKKEFRADLYYRLNVFPIRVPPLRERPEDIPLLVGHFSKEFAQRHGRTIDTIPPHAMKRLVHYHWPGNIRELQNVVERAVILSTGSVLTVPFGELDLENGEISNQDNNGGLVNVLEHLERTQIQNALEKAGGIVSGPHGAAVRLKMHRTTLIRRMQKFGIKASRKYVVSAKAADARPESAKELANSLRGAPESAAVLREVR